MIHPVILPALLALAAPVLAAPLLAAPAFVGQITVRERIVIRLPRMAAPYRVGVARQVVPVTWKEKRGPKCLGAATLVAAGMGEGNSVDLLLAVGRRMRATLHRDCRAADFYAGLYVRPGRDGMVCADRDAIRVRSGRACEIDRFRLLKAQR